MGDKARDLFVCEKGHSPALGSALASAIRAQPGVQVVPFVLIEGEYHVKGFQPDGDSVRFQPCDVADWDRLPRRPRLNARGQAQLRLEGIDALETHFAAGGAIGTTHQPRGLAGEARDRLLGLLGIGDFELAADGSTVARGGPSPGYILTREVEMHGRPVAFAFAGTAPGGLDLDDVFLDAEMLEESANLRLLQAGLAYPLFYLTLYHQLRDEMANAVQAARAASSEVWAADATMGCRVEGLSTLTDELPILPKLFRRLVSFFAANGDEADVTGFAEWLGADGERVLVRGTGRTTGFDDVVEVDEATNTVRLLHDPTQLVFVPRTKAPVV